MSDSAALRKLVTQQQLPAVFLLSADTSGDVDQIGIDDYSAAIDMTAFLISKGHKRIGFIKGDPSQSVSNRRLEGFKAACANAGLPVTRDLIRAGQFTYESGQNAALKLLSLPARPTAVDQSKGAARDRAIESQKVEVERTVNQSGAYDRDLGPQAARRHSESLRMTTRSRPAKSSSGAKPRPCAGSTRRMENTLDVTATPRTRSGSPSPVRLRRRGRKADRQDPNRRRSRPDRESRRGRGRSRAGSHTRMELR